MEVASVFVVRNHLSKHTDHYLTNIWQVPILIKGCTLVWCMFLLMTCFFLSVVSMYGHVNFSSAWTCMSVLCMPGSCLISCWVFFFRCPSSSCSLITAGAPDITGRKPCFRKCLTDIVLPALLWPQCQSDIYSTEEKEKLQSHPESFPSSVSVDSCPERKVWSSLCSFSALWLTSCWWAWQKYTLVTVHDSTPLHKIFKGMLVFSRQVKLEFHPKCTMGHRALTQVLSDDVILRKPPLGQQEGK